MSEPCAACHAATVPPAAAALCRRALGRVLCWACREAQRDSTAHTNSAEVSMKLVLEPDDERPFWWDEAWEELATEHEALGSEETRG
jgi:hypothetical protein